MLVKSETADSTSSLEFNICIYVCFYYLKLFFFIFYFLAKFSFLSYLSHRFWKDSGVAVFSMENSKLRLNFVEQSSNDALCLPNSVCHQVHCNTITHLLRNKMKIAKHLILIASDVHHIVIFHWLSVTAQQEFLFHANHRAKLNYRKEATY